MYLEHSEITHWLYQQGNDKLDFFAFPVDNLKYGSLRIPLALPTERENGGSQYYIWETESADVLKKLKLKGVFSPETCLTARVGRRSWKFQIVFRRIYTGCLFLGSPFHHFSMIRAHISSLARDGQGLRFRTWCFWKTISAESGKNDSH